MRQYDADAVSGIPEGELLRANRELIRYFRDSDPGPLRIEVTTAEGERVSLFNARETAHLADVRDLFRGLFTAQMVALAVVLALAVAALVWSVRALAAGVLYGSLLTFALVGLTALVAVTGFDQAWRQFHFLAFTNDLWRLDPDTDHLIQMFPQAFWRDITLLIGAFTLLEALLMGAAAAAYLFLSRPREQRDQAPKARPSLPRPPQLQGPRIPPRFVH